MIRKAKRMHQPHPVDKYVGSRVRMRRIMLSISQEKLADALGLSFQQVQKYENGKNRISASRLQEISEILSVPVSFFFEDPEPTSKVDGAAHSYLSDFLSSPDGSALIKAFVRINDRTLRRRLVHLVERIGAAR